MKVNSVEVYRGPSALDGRPIVAIASIGGNAKTKQCLEFSVFPASIVDDWESITEGTSSRKHGALYVWALRDSSLIQSVCPDSCVYVQGNKGCYVQHNPHNARQCARILSSLGDGTLDDLLTLCKLTGIDQCRLMVAGDTAAIPASAFKRIKNKVAKVIPVNKWLAYTHEWASSDHLRDSHVASCDNELQAKKALGMGWSVFQVGDPVEGIMPKGSVLCPSSREFGNYRKYKIGCIACPMRCNGAKALHRYIPRHAAGDASRKAAAHRRGSNELKDHKGRVRGLYVMEA